MRRELPGVLADIARAAGEAAALALAANVGGTRVYIPAAVDDEHWLVKAVGRAAADKICAAFATDSRADKETSGESRRGQRVVIPLGPAANYTQLRRIVARRAG